MSNLRSASISAGDVMGHCASVAADADAAIESGVAKPDGPVLLAVVQHFPKPHVMTVIGAAAGRLLECQILAAPEIKQRADRRVAIRPVEQHATDDLDGGAQCHGIGRIPAGGMHGTQHVAGVADQPDIDRVTWNALRRHGDHGQSGEALLVFVVGPERRQQQIGDEAVDSQQQQRQPRRAMHATAARFWGMRIGGQTLRSQKRLMRVYHARKERGLNLSRSCGRGRPARAKRKPVG